MMVMTMLEVVTNKLLEDRDDFFLFLVPAEVPATLYGPDSTGTHIIT